MPHRRRERVPLACRGVVRAAGWLVPAAVRDEWRARWQHRLGDWWALVECGGQSRRTAATICRIVLADALRWRFGAVRPARLLRGPAVVPAAAILLLLAVTWLSHGLAATRLMLAAAQIHFRNPAPSGWLGPSVDRFVAHAVVIGFAMIVGVGAALVAGLPPRRFGVRYWVFLLAKAIGFGLAVTLAWVEGSPVVRAHLPGQELKATVGGLLPAVLYVAAFGWVLAWSVEDQRRRCPVCLRRLSLPVRMGSWASMFDPPTTELLCDAGHGRLCVCETTEGEVDLWTESDASWRELFQPN